MSGALVASLLIAVAAIGLLIILHEGGHFLMARLSGMTVRRFSIGFGPAIARWTSGRGTEFQLGVLPLGGYVQIDGMNPHDGTDPAASGSYLKKPIHLRFLTILAGPLANYALGFVLLFVFYSALFSVDLAPILLTKIAPDSPAERAGLSKGDVLIGTSSTTFDTVSDLLQAIQTSEGRPLVLRLERGGEKEERTVTPQRMQDVFRIGAGIAGTRHRPEPMGILAGAEAAWNHTILISKQLLVGLSALFRSGSRDQVEVTGPIGMVRDLSEQVERSWVHSLAYVASISILLGLSNLLPIPSLDGSRLLFLLLGFFRRKPIEPRIETLVHTAGLVLLLGLLILVSIADVAR